MTIELYKHKNYYLIMLQICNIVIKWIFTQHCHFYISRLHELSGTCNFKKGSIYLKCSCLKVRYKIFCNFERY